MPSEQPYRVAAPRPPAEPPPDPPHVQHAKQADLLAQHVEHFTKVGDTVRAAQYEAERKHTVARQVHAEHAAGALVDSLGLSHEVRPDAITYNDAVNYVAKVLHEVANGETRSHYARAHRSVAHVENAANVERLKAQWDPAADVIEHIGLTDPAHVAAARDLFPVKGA